MFLITTQKKFLSSTRRAHSTITKRLVTKETTRVPAKPQQPKVRCDIHREIRMCRTKRISTHNFGFAENMIRFANHEPLCGAYVGL
jgi:hypothetical protein